MGKFRTIAVAALVTAAAVTSSHAIVGVGAHWGFDFSLSMKDVDKDGILIPSGGSGSGFDLGLLPDYFGGFGFDDIGVGSNLIKGDGTTNYVHISRENFKSHFLNFGGKVYVDIIPFINTLELSANLGVWQYDGAVHFLDVNDQDSLVNAAHKGDPLPYDTRKLTLKEYDMSYFGLSGTPYAKLQLDASVKKTVFELPAKTFRFNAGAGFTVNFTTPLLNSNLLEEVQFHENKTPEQLVGDFANRDSDIGKKVIEKIIKELMTPRYAAHVIAGTRFKLPAIPIALYADGKFMIPITKLDENGDINGFGFLLNTGISLSF